MESKRKSTKSILILILFIMSICLMNAQKYSVEKGTASFKAKIAVNSYTGTSEQLTGSINFESGELEFTIPASSIKTPNKKRNKHMYELIKVEEHNHVTFKGNLIDFYDETLKQKQTLKVRGDFMLAGATKEIELSIDLTPEQNGLRLYANWTLLITDYNLERPSKAFMTVKDEHQMGVDAFLIKEN